MIAGNTVTAKISRPLLSEVVKRTRLFNLLDSKMASPVTWVSAPGGSGKSTLVASYLDAREHTCIWYQCDEGDADLATFFYYMGLAVKKVTPRHKGPLPLLTPEYLAGIPTFTRKYFETLFGRLPPRPEAPGTSPEFFIVLDNYQSVPADSPFHQMIAIGLDCLPARGHVVVISRSGPPRSLIRLQATDQLSLLQESDIRFSFEESKALILGRISTLEHEQIKKIHEKTKGWAAGIILSLEKNALDGAGEDTSSDFEYDRIFDYFAEEIFNRSEKELQGFLLDTAILPVLTVPLAEKLTGINSAGRILSTLNRHHFFTERLSKSKQSYQYHPLFRDFLLSRVKRAYAPEELTSLQRKAAQLLEQSGQMESAATLYCEARDRDGLSRLVSRHARELLLQGRNKTVEEWIACIPSDERIDDPWLCYWIGMCAFPFDIPRTIKYLEMAFELFKAEADPKGIYLSWVGIVDAHGFALDDWGRLDVWMETFGNLRKTYPTFSSQEIELLVSSRMLMALTLRKIDQPQMVQEWLERVSTLLEENPSFVIQMDLVFFMSVYHSWKGEYLKNSLLLERGAAEIHQRKPSPFSVIRIKLMHGIHYWVTAEYDCARRTLSEGLDMSTQSGVHIYDSLLWSFMAATEMAQGHMDAAGAMLKKQLSSLLGIAKTLDIFFYHVNSAWYALLTDKPALAVENLNTISPKVEKMGIPYYRALWNIGMAQAAFLQSRSQEANAYVQEAYRISLAMKSPVMEWYSQLVAAYFLFQENREEEGLLSLRSGISLGIKYGYIHLQFYQPSVMRFLCAKALEEKIEPAYVVGLIRKLGLTPPTADNSTTSACSLEEWPYPVRIYTLGRFEILRENKPLHFPRKAQKKPLDLLKVLIASGGQDVPAERLIDALWPEADGDLAQKSLETTLSRLRRLLGTEEVIKYRGRQLTINLSCCWVDSLVLGQMAEKCREGPASQAALLYEKTLSLHKGPFLPADADLSGVVARRETLKSELLRLTMTVGRHYEQTGAWERAADCYEKGLYTDSLSEELYRRLMLCYRNLGDHAAAVKTYNRCHRLLLAELGIKPSPKTLSVYTAMVQQQ